MKKLMTFVLMLVCVLGLAGCSGRTATVWNWAKNVKQEDINAVTPWSDGNTLEPLDDTETLELITLLNKLTKDSFIENKELSGGTPTFGIQIDIASNTYNINDSIHPNGALEMNYNEKQWLINDEDLLSFIQKVAGVTPTE